MDFPSTLPSPSVEYTSGNDNGTIQTVFESGRISQRNRFTRQRDICNVLFKFTQEELGVFENFVAADLSNGALEFNMEMPNSKTGGVTSQVVLLSEGKYDVAAIAGLDVWSVTCVIIIQNKVT